MKTVWIVNEGTPGHLSQSIGLLEAMKARIALDAVQVFGRTTARGWQRPLIRAFMGRKGRPIPSWLLDKVAKIYIPDGAPAPDLIVSSGGKSVVPARTWARRFDAPYVFIGLRKSYPANWFHTVITHVPEEANENNAIAVDLIPTPVSPALIAAYGSVEKSTWCMAVGGVSPSCQFEKRDWLALAAGMNMLAERQSVRWLLTTSRRTGVMAERILKRHLNPLALKDAIWWSEQPRREIFQFMARAEILFVTQDSTTMLTEAVSSGRPVVALRPEGLALSSGSFKNTYLKRLQEQARIVALHFGELPLFSPSEFIFNLLVDGPLDPLANELLKRLQWSG